MSDRSIVDRGTQGRGKRSCVAQAESLGQSRSGVELEL
jgi:hypothetical protein